MKKMHPYRQSLAGTLLAAREAVLAPIRVHLRNAEVTEQQWRVLRVLEDGGPLDASRLAEAALLHAPSVSRILRELVDRKLVIRDADPGDARRSVIRLSPAGNALLVATAAHTRKLLDRYAEGFGRERLDALRFELIALAEAIPELIPAQTLADSGTAAPRKSTRRPARKLQSAD